MPRRKSAAARSSRGVVGRIGRKIPNIPKPSEISPSMVSIKFISGSKDTAKSKSGQKRNLEIL